MPINLLYFFKFRYESVITFVPYLFFLIWPGCTAYSILVPQPGMEPMASAVEARSPNHWTAREPPVINSGFLLLTI